MGELMVNEKPLTPAERNRLRELEGVIRDNFMAYVAVGNALLEIREHRLYRNDDGRTWEGYCRELWDMSHQRADQLIAAKAVVENLTTIVVKDDGSPDWELLPANESQARELARLAPEEQITVWRNLIDSRQAAEGDQQVRLTAKTVRAAVKAVKGEQLTRTARDAADRVKKESKGGERKSQEFVAAFEHLMMLIEREQEADWRQISRKTVFNALCALAQTVGEVDEETIWGKKVLWRANNVEKLLAEGFSIFRESRDGKLIERMESPGQWLVYGEYADPEQGDTAFAELMLEPMNIQA